MLDLTVAAIPGFFATMGFEHAWLRRHADERGIVAGRYERRDTLASLSMGLASLVVPTAMSKLLRPVVPGRGRYGKVLVGVVVGAAAATTIADVVVRTADGIPDAGTRPEPATRPAADLAEDPPAVGERRALRVARRVASSGAVVAVAGGIVAGSTAWAARTGINRMWRRTGHRRDLGSGLLPALGAIFAWDLVYYWNHRLQHESRWLWAIHVVHHSSERYNLSTALRQPVGEVLGAFVPMGILSALGFRPSLVEAARGINLLYQYWIHTEAIGKLGWAEEVLNTPSHHRAHHGTNRQYLDRNHGSILIVWDRLFGTFEREDEPVTYGLTRNIDTFNPLRVATKEHVEMLRDVAGATTWRDRVGFVLRGPGWAYQRKAELAMPSLEPAVA